MSHAKRSIAFICALLMCLSLLSGFVVSASVSTAETATDAYEKIEAESIDASGVITPKENV